MEYNDGDIVLCRVLEVGKTAVSVVLEENDKIDGTIPISEIAPGRIRNLRDYVVPNKRIVCKVLKRNLTGTLTLSLRRVSIKEMKDVLDERKKEKTAAKILEIALGDEVLAKDLYFRIVDGENKKLKEFFDLVKIDNKLLGKYLSGDKYDKVLKMLLEKNDKEKEVKKDVCLKSKKSLGLLDIKSILSSCSCDVTYIAGGKYSLKIKSNDLKLADNKIIFEIDKIEKLCKEKGVDFSRIEK